MFGCRVLEPSATSIVFFSILLLGVFLLLRHWLRCLVSISLLLLLLLFYVCDYLFNSFDEIHKIIAKIIRIDDLLCVELKLNVYRECEPVHSIKLLSNRTRRIRTMENESIGGNSHKIWHGACRKYTIFLCICLLRMRHTMVDTCLTWPDSNAKYIWK